MTPDAIDLAAVEIHTSHDVRRWPATATITALQFRATGVHVEHTKRAGPDKWPNFRPPGWDGDLQYTLWIFLQIGGRWHGMGGIQFWEDCDQNGGPPEEFAKNWYYAADRWAPMTGHQPAPGERVGFMVSAGDARNNGAHSVDERSNIVLLPFPRSGEGYTAPPAAPEAPAPAPTPDPGPPVDLPPLPVPEPLPPHPPAPSPDRLVAVLEQAVLVLEQGSRAIQRLEATVVTKQDLAALRAELLALAKGLGAALGSGSVPQNAALAALTRLLDRR